MQNARFFWKTYTECVQVYLMSEGLKILIWPTSSDVSVYTNMLIEAEIVTGLEYIRGQGSPDIRAAHNY